MLGYDVSVKTNLGGKMSYVPAEVVMEKPDMYNESWRWAICQPDAHWGEYTHGKAASREQAEKDAFSALHLIHWKQERGLI
jgi:hypothetical protein